MGCYTGDRGVGGCRGIWCADGRCCFKVLAAYVASLSIEDAFFPSANKTLAEDEWHLQNVIEMIAPWQCHYGASTNRVHHMFLPCR